MSSKDCIPESAASTCEDANFSVESFLANAWDNLSNGRFASGLIPTDASTDQNSASGERLQYKKGNLMNLLSTLSYIIHYIICSILIFLL